MNTKAYTNETVFRGDTVASGSTFNIRTATSNHYDGPKWIISDFIAMDGSSYGATSSQPYRTLVHSDYNYYYDEKGNLIGEGISNDGKISAACFVNSVETLTYIQNKLNEWGYPSYPYNIKGSVSTAFFRGH